MNHKLLFALRIGIAMSISSLFTLCFGPAPGDSENSSGGFTYPESIWVYLTAGIVTWFPSLDTASTIKKSVERIAGTILGCALGLAIGFLSLSLSSAGSKEQAAILGVAVAIVQFAAPYYCVKKKLLGYIQLMAFVTTGFIALAFYTLDSRPWWAGLWRAINIIVGCFIGTLVCVSVFPVSVKNVLDDQMQGSMKEIGRAIRLLLEASASKIEANDSMAIKKKRECYGLRESRKLALVSELIMEGSLQKDKIHSAYSKSLQLVNSSRAQMPLVNYEPFMWFSNQLDKTKMEKYYKSLHLQRARLLRLVMVTFHLDALLRHAIQAIDLSEIKGLVEILLKTGKRLEMLLDLEGNADMSSNKERNEIAQMLLTENFTEIRNVRLHGLPPVIQPTNAIASLEEKLKEVDGSPSMIFLEEGAETDTIAFFLQNVENVIIRAVRLHYSCSRKREGQEQEASGDKSIGSKSEAEEQDPEEYNV